MSFFPPPPSTSAQESPFARLANAQPLGSLGTSQTLGSLGTSQTLGSLGTSQPFGLLGTSQPPQKPPLLFPGLGTSANAQPSQNILGAFGTSQAQPTPGSAAAGGGLLGFAQPAKSQPQQTQNNPASNQSFGLSLLASQQPQQQPQNQNGQPPEAGSQPPPASGSATIPQQGYFNSLLEKGKKRARVGDGGPAFGELPTLQLGLEDIARRARELGGFPSQEKGHSTDGKASDQRKSLRLQGN